MSFSDEVNAVKIAKAAQESERDELEEPARIHFDAEVRDLWIATEEYWRGNAHAVDSADALFIATGRWEGRGEMVTPPFPSVKVFTRLRSRTEWTSGARVPDELIEGIRVNDWFALCAPGTLRELRIEPDLAHFSVQRLLNATSADKKEILEMHTQAYQQSYLQVPWSEARSAVRAHDDAFGVGFAGPAGKQDVVLMCGAQGPIEVYVASGDGWDRRGTLRELVVSAVAELPL